MPYYPITGIEDGLAGDKTNPLRQVPLRMELNDWCNSTDVVHKNQRALFFQAFNNFCLMDPKEKLSFFQIAGIHGQPFVSWDEDEGAPVASKRSGYCTHNSILFTTWHRPYMLLFEQVLYGLMKDVADTFPETEKPAMLEALQSWRFPYWDWAAKKHDPNHPLAPADYNVPIVIPYRGVEIKVPASFKAKAQAPSFTEGQVWSDPSLPVPGEHRQAVTNPFYQFTMPDGYENMGDSKLGKSAIIASSWTDEGVEYHYPLNDCKGTTRHAKLGPKPNLEEHWIGGTQDNEAVVRDLRSLTYEVDDHEIPGSLRASPSDAFYRVVVIPKFEDFGTKRVQGMGPDEPNNSKQNVYDSAESLHDWIHGVCGGDQAEHKEGGKSLFLLGHMSNVPVAAFDPIFWVHHCNVDRMVAIWEVLHSDDPENWFDGTDARDKDSGNWAIRRNHADLPSDDLRPFHKDEGGSYWKSNDIRETAPLGYTYPELEKWKYVDGQGEYDLAAHKAALSAYLNALHNSAARAAFQARLTADPGEEADDSSKPNLHQLKLKAPDPTPDEDIIGFNDYVVNVVYNRFALGGRPYTIHIFVGKVSDQVPYTFDDPEGSLVGQVYTFSSPADQQGTSAEVGCVNCRDQQAAEVMSSGTVVLTNALITRWKNQLVHTPRQRMLSSSAGAEVQSHDQVPQVLASMEPEDVVPFLQTNLRWRVTSLDGLVPPEQLPSLRVSVAVGKADHYADRTKLSRFYDYKGASEVTKDRPQGAGPDDGLYPPGWDYNTQP